MHESNGIQNFNHTSIRGGDSRSENIVAFRSAKDPPSPPPHKRYFRGAKGDDDGGRACKLTSP